MDYYKRKAIALKKIDEMVNKFISSDLNKYPIFGIINTICTNVDYAVSDKIVVKRLHDLQDYYGKITVDGDYIYKK